MPNPRSTRSNLQGAHKTSWPFWHIALQQGEAERSMFYDSSCLVKALFCKCLIQRQCTHESIARWLKEFVLLCQDLLLDTSVVPSMTALTTHLVAFNLLESMSLVIAVLYTLDVFGRRFLSSSTTVESIEAELNSTDMNDTASTDLTVTVTHVIDAPWIISGVSLICTILWGLAQHSMTKYSCLPIVFGGWCCVLPVSFFILAWISNAIAATILATIVLAIAIVVWLIPLCFFALGTPKLDPYLNYDHPVDPVENYPKAEELFAFTMGIYSLIPFFGACFLRNIGNMEGPGCGIKIGLPALHRKHEEGYYEHGLRIMEDVPGKTWGNSDSSFTLLTQIQLFRHQQVLAEWLFRILDGFENWGPPNLTSKHFSLQCHRFWGTPSQGRPQMNVCEDARLVR